MIGALGWLVVAPTVGGVFLGRWLDRRFDTGIFWTGALICVGLALGCALAWRRIQEIQREDDHDRGRNRAACLLFAARGFVLGGASYAASGSTPRFISAAAPGAPPSCTWPAWRSWPPCWSGRRGRAHGPLLSLAPGWSLRGPSSSRSWPG